MFMIVYVSVVHAMKIHLMSYFFGLSSEQNIVSLQLVKSAGSPLRVQRLLFSPQHQAGWI